MENECAFYGPLLNAYLDGELPEKERKEIEAHLETCQKCRQLVQELEQIGDTLKEAFADVPEPEIDLTDIWEKIEAKANFGPSIWQRFKDLFIKPVIWLPATAAVAVAAALVFTISIRTMHVPLEMSRVESVYSQSGQVMVLQTAKSGRPIIWILPEVQKQG